MNVLPPYWPMLAAALLLPLLSTTLRRIACLIAPLGSLYLVATLPEGVSHAFGFLGQEIVLVRSDALSRIFGLVFAVAAAAAGYCAAGGSARSAGSTAARRW